MPSSQCEVVERGAQCAEPAYTTVHDPAAWAQVRHPVCKRHFDLAYQRGEMFQFVRPPAVKRRSRKAAA